MPRLSPCWPIRKIRNWRVPGAVEEAARTLGRELLVLNASTPDEIDTAFVTLRQRRAGALLVSGDPYLTIRRQQIVALAARDAIPAMYFNREFVADGGLMSYGNDVADGYRRAALYVGRILKGEKPADLPVDQADQVRVRDQPENRQDARPRCASRALRTRRRGDRMRRRQAKLVRSAGVSPAQVRP